ncbi:MAG: serine/threonine-protein kinase, partial [Thermohalobaculum sp.]|nr:serine/threonine-protein kinase [Thermohalobaculum sp.]
MTTPKQGMLAPGVVLNYTYEIVALIGEGGTGEVYLARNKATGREVAIKLLKREFAADPTLVELMQREANALHEIVHPAVVRYYELLRTEMEGGITFLVMEFIRGESLGDRLRRGPVPADEIMQIAHRVIDGLEVAHNHKVLHRDLTPANVILRDGDPAKATLIDFGIAKDLAQTKHSVIGGGFAGTYQYASPEQIDGRQLDPRSDFYSLGATLLAACEGKGAGDGKTLEQIIGGKIRVPETEHLPGVLRPLIQALLQPNPDDRPGRRAIHPHRRLSWRPSRRSCRPGAPGRATTPGGTRCCRPRPRSPPRWARDPLAGRRRSAAHRRSSPGRPARARRGRCRHGRRLARSTRRDPRGLVRRRPDALGGARGARA